MDRPFIERLQIRNYGCLANVELELTRLHALIGPNDSGKSTVVMALRTLTTLALGPLSNADDSGKIDNSIRLNGGFLFETTAGGHRWWLGAGPKEVLAPRDAGNWSKWGDRAQGLNVNAGSQLLRGSALGEAVAGSHLLRLEPDALREATPLIAEGQPLRFTNALGRGLPALYDAIVTRDLPAYMAINARVAELFPTVKSLALKNPSTSTKALGIQLKDGTYVGADFMSEGMLYYLAYAVLPHLEPVGVILIEEPENGLHPARIVEVMRVLREISKTTQVVLATHSPLVVNELQPEEVTILTRDPVSGTRARRIKDTPNFAERSRVYALGELWVSYADGKVEAPLFADPEPADDLGDPVEWTDPSGA